MLSFIAQSAEPVAEAVTAWQALVAFIAPIIIGLITNDETKTRIKKALPVVISIGTWGITYLGNTDMGAELLVLMPVLWGGIQMMYELYSAAVAIFKGSDASVNDVLMPTRALIR